MSDLKLGRPYLRPDGKMDWVRLPICRCNGRRGPLGGVCGNCGNAIPIVPCEVKDE
jgi:hypothetical protein